MASILDIDDYIRQLASNQRIRSFHPNFISKRLGLPLNDVIKRLNYLSEGGLLDIKYEIRCLDDLTILKTVDDYSSFLNKEMYCTRCDCDVQIVLENVFPIYVINEEYRNHLKKNFTMRAIQAF